MQKLVYVAHPFQGLQSNVKNVESIILRLIKLYPTVTFFSPLHATGFYYHEKTYENGMKDCLTMLSKCDELWLSEGWEQSTGCKIEYDWWKANKRKPIKLVKDMLEGTTYENNSESVANTKQNSS
jgi:hypothetical protein